MISNFLIHYALSENKNKFYTVHQIPEKPHCLGEIKYTLDEIFHLMSKLNLGGYLWETK